MAQANINTGTLPNDKTGDSLRTAMIKVQNNFTELYTTAPISNSVNIGNTTSNVLANSTTVFIGNSGTYSIANSSSVTATSGYYSQVLNSGANNLVIGTTNATSILVYTNGITSANQRMIVAANGNVGVGNAAPNELLTVGGTLSANQVIIGNTTVNFTINATFIPATANYALIANGTNFVGSVSAANVVSNAQLSANLSNYLTLAGVVANVLVVTANNTSFVGSVSAANVVSNAQLSSNLSNYQTTAGLTANVAAYLPTYTGVVNAASHTVGSSTIANSTGVYTGVVNAASHTVGSSFIANTTGTYHTGTINAASHTVGSSTIANSTGVYTGVVNGSSISVGSSTIANSTGVYTGVVNADSHTVGSSFIANSTGVTANSLVVSTNTATIGSSVYVAANGNIGIGGNTTPQAPLVWSGNSNNSFGYFNIINSNTGSNTYTGVSIFGGNTNSLLYSNPTYGAFVGSTTNNPLNFLVNNAVQAYISASGDFYINSGYGSYSKTFGVRAWINFYDNAVRNSGNISGISKQSTGYFIVYIDNDMPDGNYAAVANYSKRNENTGDLNDGQAMCWDYNSAYVRVTVSKGDGVIVEPSYVCSVIITR